MSEIYQEHTMKKIYAVLLTLNLSLIVPTVVNAANETRSMRTQSGEIIVIGDRFSKLSQAMQHVPQPIQSYEFKENKNRYTASVYHYEINQIIYSITVVNNTITKIEWFRK